MNKTNHFNLPEKILKAMYQIIAAAWNLQINVYRFRNPQLFNKSQWLGWGCKTVGKVPV